MEAVREGALTVEMIQAAREKMLEEALAGDPYKELMGRVDFVRILTHCLAKKPPGWVLSEMRGDGAAWINQKRQLVVIASYSIELDRHYWLHLSMSHRSRIPTYDEMKYLKRHWAGPGEKAMEIHAPDSEHVNICSRARHLWVCMTGDPLPDFTAGLRSI